MAANGKQNAEKLVRDHGMVAIMNKVPMTLVRPDMPRNEQGRSKENGGKDRENDKKQKREVEDRRKVEVVGVS